LECRTEHQGAKLIKVIVVDDSALIRKLLTEILNSDPDIQVVDVAVDPYAAREKIKAHNPDVVTLDVEMPKMDGITFLKNLMRLRPMPVVMISSLTQDGADITLQALDVGAVDFIGKPKVDLEHGIQEYAEEIIRKVKNAAVAKVRPYKGDVKSEDVRKKYSADVVLGKGHAPRHFRTTDRIIGIGASTGGTEAIKEVLMALPPEMPGIVITQHIPEAFSAPFAARLDSNSALSVAEAHDGQQILPGHAYVAPGNRHLIVERSGARYICRLNSGPPVNRHKPSVDVMFRSLARNAGPNAISVMLTGMGDDGAEGMGEMLAAGASTMAQDEKTSVVWGMPGEVVKRGYAQQVLPLNSIAEALKSVAWSR